jgi:hypothetical protein
MTPSEAQSALEGRRTFPVMEASLGRIKELHAQCLAHGIAAAMVRPPRRDGG